MGLFGKPKILVEIIGEEGIKSRKKYPVEGNKVVIRPARRGPGGTAYKPEFDKDCLLNYWSGWGPFKRLKQKLLLIDGADRCVSFRTKPNEGVVEVEMPTFDRKTAEDLFKANVIKAAGSTLQKITVPISMYLLLGMVAVMNFIILLILTGRIRV